LIRWRLKLEEYDYEIIHHARKDNTNSDALSRNPIADKSQVNHVAREIKECKYSKAEKQQILYTTISPSKGIKE